VSQVDQPAWVAKASKITWITLCRYQKEIDASKANGSYDAALASLWQNNGDSKSQKIQDSISNVCFYASNATDSLVIPQTCDNGNKLQSWNFKKLSDDQVQWIHELSGNCVKYITAENQTYLLTAKCDPADGSQNWNGKLLNSRVQKTKYKISIKPTIDLSLCLRAEYYDEESSVMNVVPCSK